jgi:hypothetical protein
MQGCSDTIDFQININSPEADIEEMEKLTLGLRQEFIDLDIEKIDLVREENIPDRAKVVEPISWGVLLIQLTASGGALTMLIKTLERWLTNNQKSSISIECNGKKFSLEGPITKEERKQLIDNWINSVQKKESQ